MDIDNIWKGFKSVVDDPARLKDFGFTLLEDAAPFSLYRMDYTIAHDMAELDDEFYLQAHGLMYDSMEEVIEALNFEQKHNDLSDERRATLFRLWMEITDNYDLATELEILRKQRDSIQTRMEEIETELNK